MKVLYPDSAKNYSDFKRINEYLTKTLNITDIYEETDVAKLEAQIEGLEKEDFNINGKHQYSNALKKYTLFLKLKQEFEKEYQEYLQPISVEKITDDIRTCIPYLIAMRTKPFLLLAGISGTGKSRIVREFAFLTCPKVLQDKDGTTPGNYCMIEVKPNWHDSTELLGYYSNIRGKYVVTSFVKFLIQAKLYPEVPFFVCLDEMNLAPVEQYFAEFLSVLETRKCGNYGNIVSGAIIKKNVFSVFENPDGDKAIQLIKELGLDKEKDKEIIAELRNIGLTLPDNVIVVGTVNMDDTTYKFSRKVIDRAMTIEMNGGKLSDMFGKSTQLTYRDDKNEEEGKRPLPLAMFKATYVTADDAISKCKNMQGFLTFVKGSEDDPDTLSGRLKAINNCLEGTPFQVSYRVLNELVIYLAVLLDMEQNVTEDLFKTLMDNAIDEIMVMKILPRIEGDEEMFELERGKTLQKNKLEQLVEVARIKDGKSSKKLKEMNDRLKRSSFTRFWP